MIDKIGLRKKGVGMNEYGKIIERLGVDRPADSSRMHTDWYNMRISYYPDSCQLVIQNSLHKLYNSIYTNNADNANDFHLAHLNTLTDLLTIMYFDCGAEDLKLSEIMEFGFNIDLGAIKPATIYDRWLSNRNAFVVVGSKKGIPIQRTSHTSDYRIKVYDKSREAGIRNKNILRYEIAATELRHIKKILAVSDPTLQSITEHESWVKLYYHLLKTYDNTKKIPLMPGAILREDLYDIFSYCDPLLASDISRGMNKSTYNQLRAVFKRKYHYYDQHPDNLHKLIRTKMEDKFMDLCN